AHRRQDRSSDQLRVIAHQPQVQGLPGRPERRQDWLRVRAPPRKGRQDGSQEVCGWRLEGSEESRQENGQEGCCEESEQNGGKSRQAGSTGDIGRSGRRPAILNKAQSWPGQQNAVCTAGQDTPASIGQRPRSRQTARQLGTRDTPERFPVNVIERCNNRATSTATQKGRPRHGCSARHQPQTSCLKNRESCGT